MPRARLKGSRRLCRCSPFRRVTYELDVIGHNGRMAGRTRKWWVRRRAAESEERGLHHLVVVGGSLAEWDAFDDVGWTGRLDSLIEAARRSGASFVSVFPYESEVPVSATAPGGGSERHRRLLEVGSDSSRIRVSVDPCVDGRQRICDVVASWPVDRPMSEEALGAALSGDAGEADLVVILGPADRLPRSVVWELAYSELVFIPCSWRDLSAEDVVSAVSEFAGRNRRFGGVDQ